MSWDFDEPDAVGGERLNPSDCIGHLLIVWAVEYIDHSPTRFTKPDQKADVIVVDVVDLDAADEEGYQGALYRRCWWRQARLIGALRNKIGNPNPLLGWMQQGVATMGRPPYELQSATSDPDARARAEAWAKAHPDFKPSTSRAAAQDEKWSQQSLRDPSPVEERAAQAAGVEVAYKERLERLAQSQQAAAARLPKPPLPPARSGDEIPPF